MHKIQVQVYYTYKFNIEAQVVKKLTKIYNLFMRNKYKIELINARKA